MRPTADIIAEYDQIIAQAKTRQSGCGYHLHHVAEIYYSKPECEERKLKEVVPVTPSEHWLLHKLILLAQQRADPAGAWFGWDNTRRVAKRTDAACTSGDLSDEELKSLPPVPEQEPLFMKHAERYDRATAKYGLLRPVKDYVLSKAEKASVGRLANKAGLCFPCYRQDSDLAGYSARNAYQVTVLEAAIKQVTGKNPILADYAPPQPCFIPEEAWEEPLAWGRLNCSWRAHCQKAKKHSPGKESLPHKQLSLYEETPNSEKDL